MWTFKSRRDLAEVRPRFEKLTNAMIENAAISPTGQRAVFEAHGEILTVPAEKGDIRNLTNNSERRRSRSRLVAGWQIHRLFFR